MTESLKLTPTEELIMTIPTTVTLPTGTWAIDPGHAEVAFIGRHFMLTKVRGRFKLRRAIDRDRRDRVAVRLGLVPVSTAMRSRLRNRT